MMVAVMIVICTDFKWEIVATFSQSQTHMELSLESVHVQHTSSTHHRK